MTNNISFNDLLFDLEVFMEVVFTYKKVKYNITYDEEFAYLFNDKKELAKIPVNKAELMVDLPLFDNNSLKKIWRSVEVINM